MKTKQRLIGRFIIVDQRICHGQPTFRGTRVMVADVLEQVASGMACEAIVEEWRGKVPREAITEAVRLAREVLMTHTPDVVRMMGTAESLRP